MSESFMEESLQDIYDTPLLDLIFRAASVHRKFHDPTEVQMSTLVSIKTGGCPEDCHYCPQAARYHTDIEVHGLLSKESVLEKAAQAKAQGSSRVCLGAAWREVKNNQEFDNVIEMVRDISNLGMEVCCTLGMLTLDQAQRLAQAGLFAYNHNVDTSKDFYSKIISTRTYDDRLRTIENVRKAKITVCSGGIIGMGESVHDRLSMIGLLASLDPPPESVPINALVPVPGTPLEEQSYVSIWEMVRMIATTRIAIPTTMVRLSAGRTEMSAAEQALCFLAGANSIFTGNKLLTTPNPEFEDDLELLSTLGLKPRPAFKRAEASIPAEL